METPNNIPNPANPYDYAGADHNIGLDYVIQNFDQITGPVDLTSINLTTNFGVSQFDLDYSETNSYLTTIYNSNSNYLLNNGGDIPNAVSNIISDWSGTDAAKTYITDITNTVLNYTNDASIDELIDNIKAIETVIIADTSLTSEESRKLLFSSSVARYGSYYWFTVYNSEPPTWPTNEGNNSAPFWSWLKQNWKKIVQVICEDVSTYILADISIPTGNGWTTITASVLISTSAYLN